VVGNILRGALPPRRRRRGEVAERCGSNGELRQHGELREPVLAELTSFLLQRRRARWPAIGAADLLSSSIELAADHGTRSAPETFFAPLCFGRSPESLYISLVDSSRSMFEDSEPMDDAPMDDAPMDDAPAAPVEDSEPSAEPASPPPADVGEGAGEAPAAAAWREFLADAERNAGSGNGLAPFWKVQQATAGGQGAAT